MRKQLRRWLPGISLALLSAAIATGGVALIVEGAHTPANFDDMTRVDAVVTSHEVAGPARSDSCPSDSDVYAEAEYEIEGRTYQVRNWGDICGDTGKSLRVGDTIDVAYEPDNPAESWSLVGDSADQEIIRRRYIGFAIGVVLLLGGL